MTGTLALKTTLEIPPGTVPVQETLKLKREFRARRRGVYQ